VVTDLPGLREIFKDAAIYAQVENPADLARAITDVLKDPQLQSDLKLRARTRAASEGYDKVAREIFEIMLR
jgi:glycosyltransferase involved in cell wall biosynthesis